MADAIVLPAEIKRTLLFRQIAFLLGIAASVALGVYIVLWSQTPNYGLLYGSLSSQDVSQVLEVLQKAGIDYRIEESSGAVMVPSAKIYDARLKLAAENLPKSANLGFGILQEEQKIGTSQFMERARYQYALESELSRTIEKVDAVRGARVHLAMPKQSTFIRNRKSTSASVMLDLYNGHRLELGTVAAIASLVAASVPELKTKDVSIVDQNGRLMTHGSASEEIMMSDNHFQYAQRVENSYIKRIEGILAPIVGPNGVKAQVTAEFDFTSTEQTRESYNPDLPALRSEQIQEDVQSGAVAHGGIPGALSNQPPADASVPEVAAEGTVANTQPVQRSSTQKRATRNYELDKTISHTRMPVGSLRRLSVAVLLDYKRIVDDKGVISYVEHSPEELRQYMALVREAIGYNAVRGDTVNVMNAEFSKPLPVEALPEEPFWKQPWLWDIVKQVLGGVAVLFLIFGVLRPTMKNMANKEINLHQAVLENLTTTGLPAPGEAGQAQLEGKHNDQVKAISGYDSNLSAVRGVVQNDPRLAAHVVKNWVGED
ncbi:MAG: flagellar basal-body MS-ring/collar protein FliF [Gammaproteobacteria bacterium]|nr:flagellar basal-body MS-ring/collar protein FliF [Gammaproteobacteria bacterium]